MKSCLVECNSSEVFAGPLRLRRLLTSDREIVPTPHSAAPKLQQVTQSPGRQLEVYACCVEIQHSVWTSNSDSFNCIRYIEVFWYIESLLML